MNDPTRLSTWHEIFLQATGALGGIAAEAIPRLLVVIAALAIAWLLASAVELVVGGGLRRLGFDRAWSRVRMTEVLGRAGLAMTPSETIGRVLFWAVMISVLLAAARTLGIAAVTATTDRFVAYVPNLIGAGVTVLLGLLLARFAGAVFGSAAAAAGFASAARLGFVVQVLVAVLVCVVAIEQLGVSTSVLVGPITAVLAAAGFAAGLAFALGAHPIVTHILAGHFLKQSLPRDTFVEVSGERGVVDRIGATETVLRSGDRSWSVPNGRLLGEIVVR